MYVQFTSSVYGLQICQISYYNISRKNPAMESFFSVVADPSLQRYYKLQKPSDIPIILNITFSVALKTEW